MRQFHNIDPCRIVEEEDCSGTGLMVNRERCDLEMAKRKARSARRMGRESRGRSVLRIPVSERSRRATKQRRRRKEESQIVRIGKI